MKKNIIISVCLALIFIGIDTINTINAQENSTYDFERIEDNSFLIEEAYNQEPGVIQHISTFQYMKDKTWGYSFTDEWPVPGFDHQLSFTLPISHQSKTGVGDLALNYRYQAIRGQRLAFSPRASLLLPTGDYKNGMGAGVMGYQINLPVSYIISHKLVTHYNIGSTLIPGAKLPGNGTYDVVSFFYGGSVILLLSESFNLMFEAIGSTTSEKIKNVGTTTTNTFFINPGFRYAINCKSGLQIVPGLAIPIGIGPSSGEYGMFLYVSFEHPFWKP